MAGFGKSLLGAITGAAEGYGNYLQMEGKQRLDMEQEERQSQRAMALEQFRAGIQSDRDTAEDTRARGRIVLTGLVNRTNNQAEIQTKGAIDAANDTRDFEMWKKKNAVEFGQWKQKTGIELTNSQKLESFKAEKQAEVKAKEEGLKPVGDDIDEATGTRVLYYRDAQGNTRTFDTGTVVQSKATTNPLTGEVTRETNKPTKKAAPGWRDEPAASTSAGAGGGQRSNLQIVMDQLATDYGSGKPVTYQGRKLSLQEAQAAARRRYGG